MMDNMDYIDECCERYEKFGRNQGSEMALDLFIMRLIAKGYDLNYDEILEIKKEILEDIKKRV